MNITEYIYLINKPDAVNEKQTVVLEKIVQEFPYFQSARALYLKGLYNQNSFKYNYVLKVAAAHTSDRSILFDFITSDSFTSINNKLYEQKLSEISAITVKESEIVEPKLEVRKNTIEQSILSSIKEAGQHEPFDIPAEVNWIPIDDENASAFVQDKTEAVEVTAMEAMTDSDVIQTEETIAAETLNEFTPQTDSEQEETIVSEMIADTSVNQEIKQTPEMPAPEQTQSTAELSEAKLEIGKPLAFSKGETHSFQEWLQLSQFKPIDRSENQSEAQSEQTQTTAENFSESDLEKQKKNELIDRFIETSPKIPPVKHDTPLTPSIIVEPSRTDNTYLMTETLARVYLEQKKYHKAIQAYEILILKYPEKSSFFADRILDIKNLQQNNK